jgi:hypothetical protein
MMLLRKCILAMFSRDMPFMTDDFVVDGSILIEITVFEGSVFPFVCLCVCDRCYE